MKRPTEPSYRMKFIKLLCEGLHIDSKLRLYSWKKKTLEATHFSITQS